MKKSTLSVITLALVLINLVLTVLLTFSLVSTNNKTNNLISKVSKIIDLDVGGINIDSSGSVSGQVNINDIEYVDVVSGDSNSITVSYTDNGKTHYVVLKVTIGLNKKSRDYEKKAESITNGMKLIVSEITNEALKYTYSSVSSNKAVIENNLLTALQNQFETEMIYSVTLSEILVQ